MSPHSWIYIEAVLCGSNVSLSFAWSWDQQNCSKCSKVHMYTINLMTTQSCLSQNWVIRYPMSYGCTRVGSPSEKVRSTAPWRLGPVQTYIGLIVYLYKLSAFETSFFLFMESWTVCAALPKEKLKKGWFCPFGFQNGQHVMNVRQPTDTYS